MNYIQKENKIVYLENGVPEKPQHSSLHIEDKLDLYDAIDCLREDYKTVIVLKYFNDLSINEISSIMELPTNTVKSHLKRAKDELRQILKEGELNE
ncbi:MAG: sigma-70 family RNA polymerase sigma factor [Turicibacter sp.]|nr:sigma-70 family RNA polymerase sigma factor [Turicibacter sp.]